ncbi:MAG: hypothetical protein LVQ96_02215 [Thermoplasmatales archaeon]|nr:hypothetical protein [Thermoplasmatales archaeon]
MKVWKQVGVFLVSWWIIGAILSLLIGWIAGLIGIMCAVFIVMRFRRKYPNVQKQIDRRETKQGNDNVKEIKRQYIAEHGKKAWRREGKPNLKRALKTEVKWLKQNWKIQQKDIKEQEKARQRALWENGKAHARDSRKYLTYTQKLKLNSMTYTHTPDEIEKIAQDWIAENKAKEGK